MGTRGKACRARRRTDAASCISSAGLCLERPNYANVSPRFFCGTTKSSVSTLELEFPRRETQFAATRAGFRVVLKRNCSISPRGLLLAFALLAALALGIAAAFAALGAWLILPFAGLELLLGAAFWVTARHAADYERIERARDRLTVDVSEGERLRRYEFDAGRLRVRLGERGRVLLDAPQARLEIGRHLDAASRAGFAAELGKRLQS